MKVYIAKHYWKNGENATWESHENIDKKIFEHLKKNYHNFVKDRPLMIKEAKQYIYICYEDSMDIYKRKITNITFFISKYKINEGLCSKDYHNLELSLFNLQVKFLLKGFSVVVGILLLIYNIFFSSENIKNRLDTNKTLMIKDEIRDKNGSRKKLPKEAQVTNNKKSNNSEKEELKKYDSINKKIQVLDTCIKNKEKIEACKTYFYEIQMEYKKKNFNNIDIKNNIKKVQKSLNEYIKILLKKKNYKRAK